MDLLNKIKNPCLSIILFVLPMIAMADAQSGLIKKIKVTEDQVTFTLKSVSGEICLQGDEAYVFDLTTPVKKYWAAMILAASHTHKRIAVRFDKCAVRGDKRVMYIYQDFK